MTRSDPAGHDPGEYTARLIPLADYVEAAGREWHDLTASASTPNSFAERWFIDASVRHLNAPEDACMVEVRADGFLIGLMPIASAPAYGRMRVRHVENWLHFHSFLGEPLVRQGHETPFWTAALDALDASPLPAFLHVVALPAESPLTASLLAARKGAAVVHRSTRALLASNLSPTAYYEETVRKKKRKEIGRLQSRLAELGTVSARRIAAGDDLDDWTDAFLKLEASGWKGTDGAALANEATTEAFLRAALRGAFAAGRLEMIRLNLDSRPIAMLVNFLAPPGSFSFKIAFDEDFARFSPGVLVQLENLKILERPDIAWMDSCAAEDHPMINSLWGERRTIVRVSVPLAGLGRRALFSLCRSAEEGSAMLRRMRHS